MSVPRMACNAPCCQAPLPGSLEVEAPLQLGAVDDPADVGHGAAVVLHRARNSQRRSLRIRA